MASRQFVFRLSSEGGQQVIDDLKKIAATTPEAERALRSLTQASPQLASVADGVAVKIKAASAALNEHTQSAGNAAFATRQLGVQSIQFFSSIASGAPIMTAFVQQGHQVVDVALSTGSGFGLLTTAAKGLFSILSSPIAIGVGVAAAVVAVGIAAETTERRIGTLRNQLSLVRTDFETASVAADQAAKHLAGTTSLSTSDARAGINAVFGQGQFTGTPAQAEALVQVNAQLSRQLGEVAINAQRAGQIVVDPAGVLAQLLKEHPGITAFNQQTVDVVKHLQETGQQGEALQKTFDALTKLTANERDAVTPLQKAFQDLQNTLTGGSQAGERLATTLGGPVLTQVTNAVNAVNRLIQGIERMIALIPPGLINAISYLNTAAGYVNPVTLAINGISSLAPGATSTGAPINAPILGSTAAATQMQVRDYFKAKGLSDAAVSGILANVAAESSFNPNLTGDNGTSFGLFQHHAERLDALRTGSGTNTPSVQQQLDFAWAELQTNKSGTLAALQAAQTPGEAAAAFSRTFEVPKAADAEAARRSAAAGQFMAGSTMAGAVTAPSADLAAAGLADNTPEARRLKALEDISKAEAALQLPNLDDAHIKQYGQALDEARKRLYDAVTASDALERSVGIQQTAEDRLTAAWGQGAIAAAHMVNQLKAEDAVRATLNPNTAQGAAAVQRLALAYDDLGRKQELAKLAEASSVTSDQTKLIQAQIDSIGMEGVARQNLIQHMKDEQDVARQFPLVSQAERDARVKQLDGVNQLTQALQRQQQAVDEVANVFSSSFDQVGQAITTTLVQGGKAAINWENVMNGVAQSVMQGFLKLAVLNPLLNALFGGSRSTLTDVGSGGGGLLGSLLGKLGGGGAALPTGNAFGVGVADATFAGGGVMTRWGPIPLNRYAGGGVADRPQMAMFGEGSMPEAYVPLPDGRSIPVSMRGGGTVVHQGDVNVHVANSNASAAMIGVTVQLAVKQANAELLAQIERGGAIAKKVGRRR